MQEIESQTEFTMQLNIQTEIVPMYNLTITIHNAWVCAFFLIPFQYYVLQCLGMYIAF